MTIASSLSNALSGLTAAARSADVVSSNIANSRTEGYGRREIELSSRMVGGIGAGVRVDGVTRHSDPVLLSDRRLADAGLGAATLRADHLSRIERAIGTPDEPGSLNGRIAAFEASLIEASSTPQSETRLAVVLDNAKALAGQLNRASDDVQQVRRDADAAIAADVEALNSGLARISDLNARIARASATGQDPSALIDQRQVAIDRIAGIVPVRELTREYGQVSLYTTGGAALLDHRPAEIGFAPSAVITPAMTIDSGGLSGLTINGRAVPTDAASGPIAGGSLAAAFEMRDETAVAIQTQLDGFARDLVDRFEAAAVDPTRAPGDPGLFTDGGTALAIANEPGLAARLSVNALADPSAGGDLWRLRSGLGAPAPGPVGDGAGFQAMLDAMGSLRSPASDAFSATARTSSGLAAELLSSVGAALRTAETEQVYAAARRDGLRVEELAQGVDTDAEMQKLLLIEQAYAANARVISTVDEMIQILTRL